MVNGTWQMQLKSKTLKQKKIHPRLSGWTHSNQIMKAENFLWLELETWGKKGNERDHSIEWIWPAFAGFYRIGIHKILAALGLRCCAQAFSGCGEQGLLSTAVPGCSLGQRLWLWSTACTARRLGGCGAWVYLSHGMWHLPGPGIKPMSPALAGGLLTTVPPGKSLLLALKMKGATSQGMWTASGSWR